MEAASPQDLSFALPTLPLTGAEHLDSLRDDREVWIYGKRVKCVTPHLCLS
jgi:4-hydroxyphenylacetate 3-monooxygenase